MTQAGSPPQSSTQEPGVVTRSTTDLVKAAVSGWMGTAMEFMDFQLYSLAAAIVFNKIFFPNVSPAIGLIAAFATYGVGYVARLVGADLLRPDGRPDRPQEGPVPHDRVDGLVHHSDRRPAHLRCRRHLGTDPAGRVAACSGLRCRRRDRRRHRDARRVRTDEETRHHRLIGLAGHQFRHPGRIRHLGPAAERAHRGTTVELGLADSVPAQLHSVGIRSLAAGQRRRKARSSKNARTLSTVSHSLATSWRKRPPPPTRVSSRPA